MATINFNGMGNPFKKEKESFLKKVLKYYIKIVSKNPCVLMTKV